MLRSKKWREVTYLDLVTFYTRELFSWLKRNFNVLIFPVIRGQIPLNSHLLMALSLKLDKIYNNNNLMLDKSVMLLWITLKGF